jgi:hypothetical protein
MVSICWIRDLECLCLVLRLWLRCGALVTLLGLRQASRLYSFPTRHLHRLLLRHVLLRSLPSLSSLSLVLRSSTFGSSSSFLAVGSRGTLDRRRGLLSHVQVLALRVVL